jgi:hypothetical protein
MKKKALGIIAASAFAIAAISGPVAAQPPLGVGKPAGVGEGAPPAGIQCQQAGISTLQTLGLLSAVAKNGIEVIDPNGDSLGIVPFRTVLALHRTAPTLFQSDGVSVVVGESVVAATWCNPSK